jgi:threonine/homoserine/homoserine lactone efflux protein
MTAGAGSIQLPVLVAGLGAVAASSSFVFELLRWTGAAYLVWLGARLLLRKSSNDSMAMARTLPSSKWRALRDGMIVNLMNPNPLVFMVAFLPQFVTPGRGSVTLQLLIFGITQKATGLVVLGAMAFGAGSVQRWLALRPGLLAYPRRFAGVVMILLAARLLVEGRSTPR